MATNEHIITYSATDVDFQDSLLPLVRIDMQQHCIEQDGLIWHIGIENWFKVVKFVERYSMVQCVGYRRVENGLTWLT